MKILQVGIYDCIISFCVFHYAYCFFFFRKRLVGCIIWTACVGESPDNDGAFLFGNVCIIDETESDDSGEIIDLAEWDDGDKPIDIEESDDGKTDDEMDISQCEEFEWAGDGNAVYDPEEGGFGFGDSSVVGEKCVSLRVQKSSK